MQKIKVSRNLLYIIGAVVLATIAALLTMTYVQQTVAERSRDTTVTVAVAVPTSDIGAGTVLSEGMLAVRNVPTDFVPSNALTPDNYDQFVGRVLRTDIRSGVPISGGALVPLHETFSSVIPQGKIAYNLSVDENNSISGMVAPGDWIDIFLLMSGGSTGGGAATQQGTRLFPLLQRIRVLATGAQVEDALVGGDDGGRGYSTITLELDQYQAKQLAVADKAGGLRVVLRKLQDDSPGTATGMTERELLRSLGDGVSAPAMGPVHRLRGAPPIEFIVGSSRG